MHCRLERRDHVTLMFQAWSQRPLSGLKPAPPVRICMTLVTLCLRFLVYKMAIARMFIQSEHACGGTGLSLEKSLVHGCWSVVRLTKWLPQVWVLSLSLAHLALVSYRARLWSSSG